jgi:hypothetical protein
MVDIDIDRARFRTDLLPTAGDMVSGTIWLQSHLSDNSDNAVSGIGYA